MIYFCSKCKEEYYGIRLKGNKCFRCGTVLHKSKPRKEKVFVKK